MKRALVGMAFAAGLLLISVKGFAAFDLEIYSASCYPSYVELDLEGTLTCEVFFVNAGPDSKKGWLRFKGLGSFTLNSSVVTIGSGTCSQTGYIWCPSSMVWIPGGWIPGEEVETAIIGLTPSQVGIFNLEITFYPVSGDAEPLDNTSLQTIAVGLSYNDLQLEVSLSEAVHNFGEALPYVFTVINAGPGPAPNTKLTANFSKPFSLDPGSSDVCAVAAEAANTVVCDIGEMAILERRSLLVRPIPSETGEFGGSALVASDMGEAGHLDNNSIALPAATISEAPVPGGGAAGGEGAGGDEETAGGEESAEGESLPSGGTCSLVYCPRSVVR